MIWPGCRRESEVHAAARSGRWTPALRAHAEACRHCADVALATAALAAAPAPRALPGDPQVLWMQARLVRRLHAQAQISRVIAVAQAAIGLVVAAALLYGAVRVDAFAALPPLLSGFGAAAGVSGLILAALMLLSRPRRTEP
jgi:hypothetical protein